MCNIFFFCARENYSQGSNSFGPMKLKTVSRPFQDLVSTFFKINEQVRGIGVWSSITFSSRRGCVSLKLLSFSRILMWKMVFYHHNHDSKCLLFCIQLKLQTELCMLKTKRSFFQLFPGLERPELNSRPSLDFKTTVGTLYSD